MGVSLRQEAVAFAFDERDTHVAVRQQRALHARTEADAMLGELSGVLERSGLAKVVFDQRGLADDLLRDALWDWARGAGRRVVIALVVEAERDRLESNTLALTSGLQLRAFGDETRAQNWLLATPAQRPTTEIPPVD